jgi:hypothetical protein
MTPICRQHFGLGMVALLGDHYKHMLIICQGRTSTANFRFQMRRLQIPVASLKNVTEGGEI